MVIPFGVGEFRPLSSNDRWHFRVKARHVAAIREGAGWAAKAAKIPPQEHITVRLHYAPGDSRRRDASNLMATQKPAVDALVDAGVVPDDTAKWVTELMPVIHEGPGRRALWLEIRAGEPS
jgi:crossover junction endodeoxyribonuclease RusA